MMLEILAARRAAEAARAGEAADEMDEAELPFELAELNAESVLHVQPLSVPGDSG